MSAIRIRILMKAATILICGPDNGQDSLKLHSGEKWRKCRRDYGQLAKAAKNCTEKSNKCRRDNGRPSFKLHYGKSGEKSNKCKRDNALKNCSQKVKMVSTSVENVRLNGSFLFELWFYCLYCEK